MKYNYDNESDILGINKSKLYNSIELIDGFWVDLDKKGSIVGVEVLDASKLLAKMSGNKINKSFLENLKNIQFSVSKYGNSFILQIAFFSQDNDQCNVSVPVYDIVPQSCLASA